MSNYNVTSIWYTSNGTSATPTWVNKEGNFPDIPVRCILQNPLLPTTEVIVGSDLGVWFTNNFNAASPTWYQSYNGMRNVKVTDLDLRNDNVVFAATYGRGVFSGTFTNAVLNNETFTRIPVFTTIQIRVNQGGSQRRLWLRHSKKCCGKNKWNVFNWNFN